MHVREINTTKSQYLIYKLCRRLSMFKQLLIPMSCYTDNLIIFQLYFVSSVNIVIMHWLTYVIEQQTLSEKLLTYTTGTTGLSSDVQLYKFDISLLVCLACYN